jgi:ribonuclease HI
MCKAFTDGSSRGNPGPGGWGVVLVSGDTVREFGGREEKTTNNRMELRAALEAIRHAPHDMVEVVTDSAYLVNGATKWLSGWKNKDWVTATKTPVYNRDLWEELDELLTTKRITFTLIRGHVGIPANERADVIATSFADSLPSPLYNGPRSRYPVSLSIPEISEEKKQGRKGKAYSYVSLVDGVVSRHETWSECEARVKGKRAARFKKALSAEEERSIVEEFERH